MSQQPSSHYLSASPGDLRNDSALQTKIPGYRTSAAFFSSLRTNLRLAETTPSPFPTPPSLRPTISDLPPLPSASVLPNGVLLEQPPQACQRPKDCLQHFQPFAVHTTANQKDRNEAIILIAESVEEQKYLAYRAILRHPVSYGLLTVTLWTGRILTSTVRPDVYGLVLAWLLAVAISCLIYWWIAMQCKKNAKDIDGLWLGHDDVIIVTMRGSLLGALVLAWEKREGKGKRKKDTRAWIRAWTVKSNCRRKGYGMALIQEAIRLVRSRGGGLLDFSDSHAHSGRFLPTIFDGPFAQRDNTAFLALSGTLEA